MFAFVEHGAQGLELLLARARHRRQRDLARVLDAHRRHLADLLARRLRRVVREPHRARRDDPRAVDHALLDVVTQRDVAFGRAAAREHRRVAGLEEPLHLRLLFGTRVDVLVRVDEPRHRRHSLRVDRLTGLLRRRAGRDGRDLAAAHDDRAALDHRAVADDDPGVSDREVLGSERRDSAEHEAKE